MTRVAWFHCFAGTAGDMTLAALVHAGADRTAGSVAARVVADVVADVVAQLQLHDDSLSYALSFERVQRCGIAATQAHVVVDDHDHDHDHDHAYPHRPYAEIRSLIDKAALPPRVAERAQRTFRLLAEVEGTMHGIDPDEVEFHEVGSTDAIIDVVGTCAALEALGIDRIVCSPITVGQGTVNAAHGQLPNPSPAVAELLARRQAPSRGIADHRELATPTGVALMCALADEFGPMPAIDVVAVGYGAGSADIAGRPNVVQVIVGTEQHAPLLPEPGQPVQLLEANVDDITGEVLAHTIAALIAAGAHDAWATPIVMKKGRPAHTLHALCDPSAAQALGEVLLTETGSLGLRGTVMQRWPQQRGEITVDVDGHPVRVKRSAGVGGSLGTVKVEHDDAAAAAAAQHRPLRDVLAEAAALAVQAMQAER